MAAPARGGEQFGRADAVDAEHHLGLRRAATAHGDHHHALAGGCQRARQAPLTAVLPTLLPVPTTASDGADTPVLACGRSSKSAPMYAAPAAAAALISRKRSR